MFQDTMTKNTGNRLSDHHGQIVPRPAQRLDKHHGNEEQIAEAATHGTTTMHPVLMVAKHLGQEELAHHMVHLLLLITDQTHHMVELLRPQLLHMDLHLAHITATDIADIMVMADTKVMINQHRRLPLQVKHLGSKRLHHQLHSMVLLLYLHHLLNPHLHHHLQHQHRLHHLHPHNKLLLTAFVFSCSSFLSYL
jgi:hypothetical protein